MSERKLISPTKLKTINLLAITELKEQISKKDTETIQAIMQTSLNNVKKEESTDAIMMRMLLPELIKNPESFQNLMEMAEIANRI